MKNPPDKKLGKRTESDVDDLQRFIAAARELECDESPEAFEAIVKKLAQAKPTTNASLKKGKKK